MSNPRIYSCTLNQACFNAKDTHLQYSACLFVIASVPIYIPFYQGKQRFILAKKSTSPSKVKRHL